MKIYSWKRLEQSFIENQAQRKHILIGGSKIYYLTNLDEDFVPTETFICIHGIASSSLVYLNMIQHLPKGSRFYLIDLPGFGKSNAPHLHRDQDFFEYSCWCLNEFMKELHIPTARWIGHSFGAFFSILFAHSYPNRVQTLILIAPTGLMPLFGYNAWYIGLLFKLHFPYFLKWIRRFIFLFYRLGWKTNYWRYILYLLSCYSDMKSTAGRVFSSCMTPLTLFTSRWNRPVLDKLIAIPKPITLVYGENDPLIPYHQGWIVREMRRNIQVEILRNHSHHLVEHIPQQIIQYSLSEHDSTPVDKRIIDRVSEIIHSTQYRTTPWFHQSWLWIQQLYLDILSIPKKELIKD